MNDGPGRRHVDGRRAILCQALLRKRAVIRRALGRELSASPNWDMLLTLYASEIEDRRIMLTALYAASHVSETTAYRRIDDLEKRGLIMRLDDPGDRRRVHVRLTDDGFESMSQMLSQIDRLIG